MKKNDLMGYIVYALMLGGAVWVGLGFVRPILTEAENAQSLPMNGLLLVLLAVLFGVVISALTLELGHLAGAKMGKYKVTSWTLLGIQFKRQENGKIQVGFGSFDGITGETKVVPLDVKKSKPRYMLYMPLVFLLIEVAVCVFMMVFGKALAVKTPSMISLYIVGLVILAVGCMIFLYNTFPATLDSKNDGAMIGVLGNETNVIAYNQILLAADRMARGEDVGETPTYESVTDFTIRLNDVALYKALQEDKYDEALRINEYTIKCKDKVSSRNYLNAVAQKIALHISLHPLAEAKQEYIDLKLEEKKFIANLSTAPAVRAHILVSGLVEESEAEVKTAMEFADNALKASGEDKRKVEEALIKAALIKVIQRHKDWDFSEYSDVVSGDEKKPEEQ